MQKIARTAEMSTKVAGVIFLYSSCEEWYSGPSVGSLDRKGSRSELVDCVMLTGVSMWLLLHELWRERAKPLWHDQVHHVRTVNRRDLLKLHADLCPWVHPADHSL